MPNFVDGLPLRDRHFALNVGFGLEEEADFVGGVEEVVAEAVFGGSGDGVEDGGIFWTGFEVVDQSIDLLNGCLTLLFRDEVGDDCVAMIFDMLGSCFDLSCYSWLHF